MSQKNLSFKSPDTWETGFDLKDSGMEEEFESFFCGAEG